ncbi:hypothetical protein FM106_08430 [Brachybacterium faecium]|nr:hypothetical protein FM106_08430 [Brachybacterium faecium]
MSRPVPSRPVPSCPVPSCPSRLVSGAGCAPAGPATLWHAVALSQHTPPLARAYAGMRPVDAQRSRLTGLATATSSRGDQRRHSTC